MATPTAKLAQVVKFCLIGLKPAFPLRMADWIRLFPSFIQPSILLLTNQQQHSGNEADAFLLTYSVMARANNNLLLKGVSGKIGPFVVRQVGGQTIIQAAEAKGKRAPRSPKQQAHLDRMHQARLYATAQTREPAAKAYYSQFIDSKCTSARTVAIADYMRRPCIMGLDVGAYRGQPGDVIRIRATDDFAVVAVQVRIFAADGVLVEEGPAAWQHGDVWHYVAQQKQALQPDSSCAVKVRDRPGNLVSECHTW